MTCLHQRTDFISKWYLLQHVVFFICRIIDILVPDVPESLAIMIKRERYLGKQALADTDTIMKVSLKVSGIVSVKINIKISVKVVETVIAGL